MLKNNKIFYFILLLPVVYYLFTCLLYLFTPSFSDHIEPSMLMLASLIEKGQLIYTELDAANRITLIYGPVPFLFNAISLSLIPNPFYAGKLCGIILTIISLFTLFNAIRINFNKEIMLICLAYSILLLISFGHISFWNRPESAILLGSALVCVGYFNKKQWLSIILFSVGSSIIINSRITSIFYILPVIVLLFYYKSNKKLLLIAILTIVLTLIPFFVFSSFSLYNYLKWISLIGSHKFSLNQFIRSTFYALLFFLPLLNLIWIRIKYIDNKILKKEFIIILSFSFSLLLTAIIASKEGAGSHHLIPFSYFIAIFLAENINMIFNNKDQLILRPPNKIVLIALGLLWITTLGYQNWIGTQKRYIDFLLSDNGRPVYTDLQKIKDKYKSYKIMMGYSGDNYESYKLTFFRPLLIDSSPDLFVEPAALMDMNESNIVIPKATIDKIDTQIYDIFLIPKPAEPFKMRSSYISRKEIFCSGIKKEFLENYKKIDQTKYYAVYMAKGVLKNSNSLLQQR